MIDIYDYVTLKYYARYLFFKCLPKFLFKYVIKYKYKKVFSLDINLKKPELLSEKVQWLKLYSKDKRKTYLADKIKVKKFIEKTIPDLKFAKVYQHASFFEELNFKKLPSEFILKTNHAWKTNVIINNKNNITSEEIKKLKKYYNKMLKINYAFWSYYEMHYSDIKPKVYAEELIKDFYNIKYYEVWCINGTPEFFSYKFLSEDEWGNNIKQYFFDTNLKQTNFYIDCRNTDKIEAPKFSKKVIEYAKELSKNIDFVRVDFMESNNEIYFCELTFTPYSGFFEFHPQCYDVIFGEKLKLEKY